MSLQDGNQHMLYTDRARSYLDEVSHQDSVKVKEQKQLQWLSSRLRDNKIPHHPARLFESLSHALACRDVEVPLIDNL